MSTENLAAALARVQAELPTVGKGETAEVEGVTKGGRPFKYKYNYADLAAVSKTILPLLGANGLSWITRPTINDGGKFVLAYELLHISGESRSGEYPLTGGTPQEIGSAITYARRYTLCSVTGVAPEQDDDDAAAASNRQPARDSWDTAAPVEKPPTPEQTAAYEALLAELGGITRRVDIGNQVGRKAVAARNSGAITPAQYRVLDVKAGERIAELEQAEQDAEKPAEPAGEPS